MLRPYRRRLAAALLLLVGTVAATVATPPLLGAAVNAISDGDEHRLELIGAAILVLGIVGAASTLARRRLAGRLTFDTECDARRRLYEHVLEVELSFVERHGAGQLLSRATGDAQSIGYFLGYGVVTLANSAATILVTAAVMFALDPLLAAVSLLPLPGLAYVSFRYGERGIPVQQEVLRRTGEITRQAQEEIAGVPLTQAFARESERLERFAATVARLFAGQLDVMRIRARYEPLIAFIAALGPLAVILLGAELAIRGEIQAGGFVTFYAFLGMLVPSLAALGPLFEMFQTATAANRRLLEITVHRPRLAAPVGAPPLPPGGGEIAFDDVSMSYGGTAALNGVSLRVPARGSLGLVGEAGSGKTVLLRLLNRIGDADSGSIRIDGEDLRRVDLTSLRDEVAVVTAEPFLFAGTVRENIAFGRPEAGPEQVEAAARAVQAHEFIAALPQGYDTPVGEHGFTLSGGERQRIAIARALLVEPRVLVLDDPTANLDAKSERAVLETLLRATAGLTAVVVTRLPAWLDRLDSVALLEGGAVRAHGTHRELQRSSEPYRRVIDRPSSAEARAALAASPGTGTGAPEPAATGRAAQAAPAESEAGPDAPDAGRPERAERAHERRLLRELAGAHRGAVALALASIVAVTTVNLVPPYLAGKAVDDVVLPADRGELPLVLSVYVAATLVALAAGYVQIQAVDRVGYRILADLRLRVLEHVQRLPLSFFGRRPAGWVVSRLTNDVDAMDSLLRNGAVTLVSSVLNLIGPMVIMVVLDPDLALLVFVTFPVILAAVLGFRALSRAVYRRVREIIAAVTAFVNESLEGLEVIHSFNREPHQRRRLSELNERTVVTKMRATRVSSAYLGLVEAFTVAAMTLVVLFGGHQVLDGEAQLGVLVTFAIYVQQFFDPIQQLASVSPGYQAATAGLANVAELLQEPAAPVERPDARPLPRLRGEVRLEGVSFGYLPGRPVVKDVDLVVAPGESVAIVGRTGAGKTTLAKMIPRFEEPERGRVLLDGADVRDVTLASLRRQVGIVPQDSLLVEGTVGENLLFARPDAERSELEAVARTFGLDALIRGGLDARVARGGRNLSSGQRQMIAIARVALADTPIVILDEATAHLDAESESAVQRALELVLAGRTTIAIAHRLSIAQAADRVVVMEDGRISQVGSPGELLAGGGAYRDLYRDWESRAAA